MQLKFTLLSVQMHNFTIIMHTSEGEDKEE